MALFDWLFGRTPKPTQHSQPERAMENYRPAPIVRAPVRPAFAHAVRVPEGSFRFVALDVETACSDVASICQIGLACVQPDNQIQTFSMLVNPGTRFDAFNIQLHGIGPDHVADAPRFPDALTALLPLLTRHHLIQHSNFDKQAMNAACGFCGIDAPDLRWSDSVQIARRAWPELKGNGGHGLANLKRLLNLQFHHHDAGEDARAAAMVVLHAEVHLRLPFEELIKPATKKNYSAAITMEGDPVTVGAANAAVARLAETDPEAGLRARIYQMLDARPAAYWPDNAPAAGSTELAILHAAINASQPVAFGYTDLNGNQTTRTVLPLVLVHPPQGVKLLAWCTAREDFRQFFVRALENPTARPGDFSNGRIALLEGLLDKYSS